MPCAVTAVQLLDGARDAAGPNAGDLLPAVDMGRGRGLQPVPVEARECAQCKGRFHKVWGEGLGGGKKGDFAALQRHMYPWALGVQRGRRGLGMGT